MILGKELLEHGIEAEANGREIDPGAPYERDKQGQWWRAGLTPRPLLHPLQREGLLAGGPNAQPSDVDTDQPSERASDGDTMPILPPTN